MNNPNGVWTGPVFFSLKLKVIIITTKFFFFFSLTLLLKLIYAKWWLEAGVGKGVNLIWIYYKKKFYRQIRPFLNI